MKRPIRPSKRPSNWGISFDLAALYYDAGRPVVYNVGILLALLGLTWTDYLSVTHEFTEMSRPEPAIVRSKIFQMYFAPRLLSGRVWAQV